MMKATGIVRRIDDLGRIVIPKEIRRTLHIRESDPLEIFTDREGQVILKKYSPIGEMTTFAKQYAESLAQVSGHATLIADRDQFIAVSGGCKQLLNKSVSRQLEEKVNNRETVIAAKGDRNYVNIAEDIAVDYAWQLITPIICEGDAIGSVALFSRDQRTKMGDTELKLAQTAAGFLGRQMEKQNGRSGAEISAVRSGLPGQTDGTINNYFVYLQFGIEKCNQLQKSFPKMKQVY